MFRLQNTKLLLFNSYNKHINRQTQHVHIGEATGGVLQAHFCYMYRNGGSMGCFAVFVVLSGLLSESECTE
jgi:hypothetical protein